MSSHRGRGSERQRVSAGFMDRWTLRRSQSAHTRLDRGTDVAQGFFLAQELKAPVRANGQRVDFKGKSLGINRRFDMACFAGSVHRLDQLFHPLFHHRDNAFSHRSRAAVELERSSSKKTTANED